ncbi:MAG: prevent-host-death family protein [Alphaproteobacteria bacterium GWC2_42_16]|nr:MAG: prevent-host-death family protein [Alphaproteobacteria bacterium GWC2_42_16]OFW74820.1 MAG: prevent-host-death family protein [Alphaproteobacteria bacterium GWA2_41_27]OFW85173.1 MAG: prevent-host-death family protein [Alphaproteobacteria bacterium RIFCSPHIGHO2_12_FULL_42_100]OFW85777.1 MAG: prevent-host-death family protein [Alphaproteobacteria bacterium RBG_16_42_14]OFW91565.1 MAG: prevent-host-death family protein [Alphaproteobacteria bacterium RIFCSPHIGHO2_12_42_13]OFW93245.1 MAG: 
MQNSMGAFEAKTHFGQLIERAIHGEETLITRRGKAVAKIVPISSTDVESAKSAAIRLRALAKDMNLGPFVWEEWKSYRDMGRK